jgi:hypothetical protein
MGLFGKKKELPVAVLEGPGLFAYEDVVGESHHRAELQSLISRVPKGQ